jgi:hypothetical protein
MRNSPPSATEQAATAATAAIAAASKTPFKTAFSITMGIGLAQLATVILFFGSIAVVVGGIGAILYGVMK